MKPSLHRFSIVVAALFFASAGRADDRWTESRLFETLLRDNLTTRRAEIEREILALKERHDRRDATAEEASQRDILLARNHLQTTLEGLILRDSSPDNAAEARWQLAALLAPEKPKRARLLLQEALSRVRASTPMRWDLYAKILLTSGDLYSRQNQPELAMRGYADLVNNPDAVNALDQTLLFQLLVAAGDSAFMAYHFETAQKRFETAYRLINTATGATRRTLEGAKQQVLLRLSWAGFRGGNYETTTRYGLEFLRVCAAGNGLDERLVTETTVALGTALFELASDEVFTTFANDPIAGDHGRRTVVLALQNFVRAGRANEVMPLARSVDRYFLASPLLVEFMDSRLQALKKLGDTLPYSEENALVVERLALGSPWLRAVTLNAPQEKSRAALVLGAAEESVAFFEREAETARSKPLYLKTHQLLVSWLGELPPGARRGSLFLRAGQMALLGDDPAAAEECLRQSLEFSQTEAERKSAHFLLVEATKKRSLAGGNRKTTNHLPYENAVDAFVRAFPNDTAAKNALFESARNAEARGDDVTARERLERLISILESGGPFDHLERERVYTALISLNARDKDLGKSRAALSDLERFAQNDRAPQQLTDKVQAANAAAQRAYATELRRQGKLVEAARSLLDWGREHASNPETPHVLLDAARDLYELGLWQDCSDASDLVVANFKEHKLAAAAYYWRGRAQEANLGFKSATMSYVAAALEDSTPLETPDRLDALERALVIFRDLDDKPWSGTVLAKLSDLSKRQGEATAAWNYALASGETFLQAHRAGDAQEIFGRLAAEPKLPHRVRDEAKLGLLTASLHLGESPTAVRTELDRMFQRLLAESRRSNRDPALRNLVSRVAALSLTEDLDEAKSIRATTFSTLNTKGLERLRQLDRRMKGCVEALRTLPYISPDSSAFSIFLEFRTHMQREYASAMVSHPDAGRAGVRYQEDAIALQLDTQRVGRELIEEADRHHDRVTISSVIEARLRNGSPGEGGLATVSRPVLPDEDFAISALNTDTLSTEGN
jgi:TolA-binding protein